MRISFAFIRHDRVLLFFLYAAIAIAFLGSTSSDFQCPGNGDYANHVTSIMQARMALVEGQFPIRVAPLEHSGWRYPLYQFYSPSVYMFAALIFRWLTPANPMAAYQLTLCAFLIFGGVYMNRLAYWFVKSRPAALLASVTYMASPYFLIVANHLTGFTEAVALGIVPASLYYTLRCYSHPIEIRTLLQTALAWYLLATTHVTTFMYTSLFVALLLLLRTLKNYRHWLNLMAAGIAYIFGCLLALWYLGPVVLFEKYLNVNNLYDVNGFGHFGVTLAKLLTPAQNILPGVGQLNVILNEIQPNIGIPMLLALGICFYVFLSKSKPENKRVDDWLPSLFIIFILSILVVWSPINIWPSLPHFLAAGQYSWRVMSQSIWIGSLLFAWSVCWLFKNKLDERHISLGLFLILVTASIWLPVPETSSLAFSAAIFNKNANLFYGNDAYMLDYKKNRKFVNPVNEASLDFINKKHEVLDIGQVQPHCQQQKDTTVCIVSPSLTTRLVELPIFYYPDLLRVTINGKPVSYTSALTRGQLATAVRPVPGVMNTIKVQFGGLRWANYLSSMAWGLWLLFLMFLTMRSIGDRHVNFR